MVKKVGGEERQYLFHDEAKALRKENRRKPGRPRTTEGAAHHVTVTVKRMRKWSAALNEALEKPRSQSARGRLRWLALEITERLGPAADPAWVPPERPPARPNYVYRLTSPSGDRRTVRRIEEAAEWYGVGVATMRAYMSKAAHKCQKVAWEGNACGWLIVERLQTNAPKEESGAQP